MHNIEIISLLRRRNSVVLFSKIMIFLTILWMLPTIYFGMLSKFLFELCFFILFLVIYYLVSNYKPPKIENEKKTRRQLGIVLNVVGIVSSVCLSTVYIPQSIFGTQTIHMMFIIAGSLPFLMVQNRALIMGLQCITFSSYLYTFIANPEQWKWAKGYTWCPIEWKYVYGNCTACTFSNVGLGSTFFFIILLIEHYIFLVYSKSIEDLRHYMETKDQFVAKISHEIRTPLNGISGCTYILRDELQKIENLPKEIATSLKVVEDCTRDILNIVNSILDFNKLKTSFASLICKPFDLHKVIKDEIAITSTTLQSMEKPVILNPPVIDENVLQYVEGDKGRLKQIFLNLLSNAIKYTNSGSVDFSVKVEKCKCNSDEICLHFAVMDTGIGIKDVKKLFQPFVQVHELNTISSSTGLGLVISKYLIEMMRGRIWVESKPKVGSNFHFTVILKKSTKSKVMKEMREQINGISEPFPMEILLVEDNCINQMVTKNLLNRMGYKNIEIAVNGAEAVEKARRKEYDLILMDIHMPIMDGWEAAKIINSTSNGHRPIIYALTASSIQDELEKCKQVGMIGHLTKPVSVHSLSEVLEESWRFLRGFKQ